MASQRNGTHNRFDRGRDSFENRRNIHRMNITHRTAANLGGMAVAVWGWRSAADQAPANSGVAGTALARRAATAAGLWIWAKMASMIRQVRTISRCEIGNGASSVIER